MYISYFVLLHIYTHIYIIICTLYKRVFDWSVCLLALKHLVSLQARVRPSVQAELDLHTADKWEERDRKKWNVVFVPLNVSLIEDALQSFFFFGFTEVVCVYIHYRSVSVCVYSTIVCRILFMPATLLDVCFLLLFQYIQTKLLQCYYREIVNIQARLCDVQGPGDDDLGSPVSLL